MSPPNEKLSAHDVLKALKRNSEPHRAPFPLHPKEKIKPLSARMFNSYAPPDFWGSWDIIASHIGSVTYDISYTAVGDTLVLAEVRYWKGADGGTQVVEDFRDSVTITTSKSVANVEVRFKGIPTGSAVRGMIDP